MSARSPRGAAAGLLAATASALLVLGGCTVGPNYQRPPITTPPQFYAPPTAAAAQAESRSLADLPWWQVFQDDALRSLIAEALKDGYDVRIATARVEQARARWGIAGADFYPQVGYNAQVLRERVSGFEPGVPKGGEAATGIIANVPTVSWEIDLWGHVRRTNEAARAAYLATEEGRRAAVLTLVSEVAGAYFDLRQLDEDLAIAQRNVKAFQDTFNLFDAQLKGGVTSALDTSDAEAALANEAAQVPVIESQIIAKENQLASLLGRRPGPIPRGTPLFQQPMPPDIPPGLPAALLMRRPDLRQSEQQLISANANVGVAESDLYPTISLTGLFGGLSPDLQHLFSTGRTWELAAGITGPIFQGGRLTAQVRLAKAQFEEAKLQYEQAVNNAFGEVSTSLTALTKLAEAEVQRQRAVRAYQEAVRLATLRYTSGFSAYFEVIDAQEHLLDAENALAQARHDRLTSLVNFYKALGGGWQVEEKPDATPPPPATPPADDAAPPPATVTAPDAAATAGATDPAAQPPAGATAQPPAGATAQPPPATR